MAHLSAKHAADIMTEAPSCTSPHKMLNDLRAGLIESEISGVPVIDHEGRLVGIITRSDLVRVRVLSEALDSYVTDELTPPADATGDVEPDFGGFRRCISQMRVRDAMRTGVETCRLDTSISEIASRMIRAHIHRIVVVDEENRPVGMISSLDLVELLCEEQQERE